MTKVDRSISKVCIDWHMLEIVSIVGARRQNDALRNKRADAGGYYGHKWQNHIEGALAEYAVAQFFELPWKENIGVTGELDVGPFEVRHTEISTGRLIIQTDEKHSDAPFIFVTGQDGIYRLRGFIPRARDFMIPGTEIVLKPGRRPVYAIDLGRLSKIAHCFNISERWKDAQK